MRKLVAALITALMMVIGLTSSPAQAACALSGDGTATSPWLISNQAELAIVGLVDGSGCLTTHNQNQFYKLTQDIALTGIFTPATLVATTSGTAEFDGNGKTISGLEVNGVSPSADSVGLFGRIQFATVKNLRIFAKSISGDNFVGTLAGTAVDSHLENISIDVEHGVFGNLDNQTSGQQIGGAVGYMNATTVSSMVFRNPEGASGVVCREMCGGLFGRTLNSSFSGVAAETKINSLGVSGGIVGSFTQDSSVTLDQMFYSGSLLGETNVGGLIGYVQNVNATQAQIKISNSAVSGDVSSRTVNTIPSAFIGKLHSSDSVARYETSYVAANFKKGNVNLDLVDLHQGFNPAITQDLIFERTFVSGLPLTQATEVTTMVNRVNIPNSWSTIGLFVDEFVLIPTKWVLDESLSGLRNNGRPMPALVFNMGFFGTINDPCEPGYYSSDGLELCTAANFGRFVSFFYSTTDVVCRAGTYQDERGGAACKPAPAGGYVVSDESVRFDLCPVGSFQSQSGQMSCDPAPAGSVVISEGATRADLCPVGTFKRLAGQAPCEDSPIGTYAPFEGTVEPLACSAGRFQPNPGSRECLLAEPGYFVAAPGASAQERCADGLVSDAGALACTPPGSGGGGGGGAGVAVKLMHKTAPKIAGPVAKAKNVLAVAGSWSSDKPVTETYRWFACTKPVAATTAAVSNSNCLEIAGASRETYSITAEDVKKFLVLEVTASDGTSTGVYSTASVNAKSLKYILLKRAPKISGTAKVGKSLTLSKATWSGSVKPAKVSYKWYRCSVAVAASENSLLTGCKAISGANKTTYVLTKTDKSKFVTAQVTAISGKVKLSYTVGASASTS